MQELHFVTAKKEPGSEQEDLSVWSQDPPVDRGNEDSAEGEAGFTLIELLVVVWIIGILSVIGIGMMGNRIEKARLAKCLTDLKSIQSTVWTHSDGVEFPAQGELWDIAWGGKKPGPYHYLTDNEDPNAGHGNDLDGFDEQNPGKAPRQRNDIKWVIVCQHNHRNLCKYVYIEDQSPPHIVFWGEQDVANYQRFVKRNTK